MTYTPLQTHIAESIKEEQAKLGYRREVIRLYYPLSMLNHLFDASMTVEEMKEWLEGFGEFAKERYGAVEISHKGERFCIKLSEEASVYVHEHMAENEFIKQLVELVASHDTTMEQIYGLFGSQKEKCVIEPVDNGEFDVVIHFEGGEDRYYYCFKDEGFHITYHRFLPGDYNDLGL